MQAGRKLDINTLESYEYISFDIFDTLVRRIVSNSKDVFEITAGHVFKNIKAFMQSDWKAGYAKRMFKLALPYGKILAQLNSFRRKK